MDAEGWYKDPYGRHQERWFSAGTPTKLVRDGQTEASDPPPNVPPPGPLVPADSHGPDLGAVDTLRADAAEDPTMDQPEITAIMEAVISPVPKMEGD
jgi:hypothetical protein